MMPPGDDALSRILVTGGAGFIGTNLAATLRARGHPVVTLDLNDNGEADHRRGDVASYRQMTDVVEEVQPELVYHLAAEYGRWNGERRYENLWSTNVVGTKHLLNIQAKYGFRLVFFSSAEVYGDYTGRMTEDVPEQVPIRLLNDYAMSKWVGEMQCMNAAEMTGVEVVRVRPVNCYGPHEQYSPYRGVIPRFVKHALAGQPFTVHRGHRRIFDYVEDTAATIANIAERFTPGAVYNVGGKESWAVSIEDLASMIIEVTGADPSLAEYAGEELFTTRMKLVDSSKAIRELAHEPKITLRDGLSRYVDWFLSDADASRR